VHAPGPSTPDKRGGYAQSLAEGHISAKLQNPPPAILRPQQQRCPVRRTPFLRTATSPDHRRTVRRLALVVGVSVLLVLGFGAAFVLAGGLSGKQSIHITICHSGSGNKFTEITPENVGVLLGHEKNDSDDIIPPFAVVNDKGEEISSSRRAIRHPLGRRGAITQASLSLQAVAANSLPRTAHADPAAEAAAVSVHPSSTTCRTSRRRPCQLRAALP
jgi:hypothetical protein